MALIFWMPEYNTGIEVIDKQHRMLVEMINELADAYDTGKDREFIAKALEKLGMYAAAHFAREENYFEVHAYPDIDEHIQEHEYFEDMLYQFEDEFKAGKQDLTDTVINFLSDWLTSHIGSSDKKYVPFLEAKGAA